MARLVILDDNPLSRHMLKKVLEQEGHSLCPVRDYDQLEGAVSNGSTDVVLINDRYDQDGGWTAFNKVKKKNRHLPAMLYALPDNTRESMTWVIKAVNAALSDLRHSEPPASIGSEDSIFRIPKSLQPCGR